jgi:hypothetical protein
MVRIRHAALSMAALSIAGAGIFSALPAGVAAAAPAYSLAPAHHPVPHTTITSNCGNGQTGANQWICVNVSESPWNVRVTDMVKEASRTLQLCVRKDDVTDECMPFQTIAAGETAEAVYNYQGPGQYCAIVWRLDRHQRHTAVDKQCVVVS